MTRTIREACAVLGTRRVVCELIAGPLLCIALFCIIETLLLFQLCIALFCIVAVGAAAVGEPTKGEMR